MKIKAKHILAIVLSLFGILTLFLTTSVILDLFGIRAREGNYVPVIVWANFIAGLLYVTTAWAIIKNKSWVVKPILTAVGVLIIGQIVFFIHVVNGGLYETKTVGAMIFRIAFTVLLTVLVFQLKSKQQKESKKNK